MAIIKQPKDPEEIKEMKVGELRKECLRVSYDLGRILNGELFFCHSCRKFFVSDAFYNDKRYSTGLFPECKKCLLLQATDYDKVNKIHIDNRDKTIKVFQKLDLPFINSLYLSALKTTKEQLGERNRSTAYQHMLVMVKTLDQYNKLTFSDSEFTVEDGDYFEDDISDSRRNRKIIKDGRKRFGEYSREDLYWLENEYQDWIARYPCDSKAQETLFRTLCCQELEAEKARKKGKPTKDLDKSVQDTMAALRIKPSQSNTDALIDSASFGSLIEKWEAEKPIPEPEDEFKDVDHIGTYIDVFFKGHLAKMMGLKNAFSNLYDKYMAKYTVTKPEIKEEDEEALFNQIFGSKLDDEGV